MHISYGERQKIMTVSLDKNPLSLIFAECL